MGMPQELELYDLFNAHFYEATAAICLILAVLLLRLDGYVGVIECIFQIAPCFFDLR